jgi:uncharacterized short protein YbdD (DUF466 family)
MIGARSLGARAAGVLVGAVAGVRWYLREISGETAYERYLQRRPQADDGPVLSRREFERQRLEDSCTPGHRCC